MTPRLSIRSFTNDQYYLDKIFYANFYKLRGFTQDSVRPVVVDLGAHCGYFSFSALAVGAKKVYSFEPFIENYKMLMHNLSDQMIAPLLTFQMGVYTKNVVLKFGYPKMIKGSYFDFANVGIETNSDSEQMAICPCTNLDNLLENYVSEPVDILKISLGYAEPDILLSSLLLLEKVKHICGESSLPPEAVELFKNRLADKGFKQFKSTQVDGEQDKILFHASQSKLEEVFL